MVSSVVQHFWAIPNGRLAFLFKPNLPFMKKSTEKPPFFGLQDRMPVVLGMLLGFQHALAMLVGLYFQLLDRNGH